MNRAQWVKLQEGDIIVHTKSGMTKRVSGLPFVRDKDILVPVGDYCLSDFEEWECKALMDRFVMAIDPGNIESAFVIVRASNFQIVQHGKMPNHLIRDMIIPAFRQQLSDDPKDRCIELIGHYGTGMPAGQEVFDTCIWTGRFAEAFGGDVPLVKRATVKTHVCGLARAKDSNVIQALKDRFGDKGTIKAPGFFFGVKSDVWQAFSLALYWIEVGSK